jgi:large subunit ribosomal protein L24
MRKLKKWDPVIVIAWACKWKKSVIIKVDGDRVYLKDVKKVKKAVKWQWFVQKEASIHISNVAYFDEKLGKPSRIGIKIDEKTGKKVRYSKGSWIIIPENSMKV